MNKVITINLNGRAYQLEEAGYETLRAYLDQAAAKLQGNPDKDEIMADFEQAIADKCDAYLGSHKNVIGAAEIDEIIKKMGPVDAGGGERAAADAPNAGRAGGTLPPKRLFQIREGAWISGVCNGLAAYFNVDVALVRILFVLLGILTHGFGVAAYVILMILMPVARTDDDLAAARGVKPLNAHDFIEQAKSRYADFEREFAKRPEQPDAMAGREAWHKWRDDMKAWRREWKADMRRERGMRRAEMHAHRHELHEQYGMGFFRFVVGVILVFLFAAWIMALVSVVSHGTAFGFALAAGHPLWVPIVFLCALFYVVAAPFRLLMRNARPWRRRHYSAFIDIVESLFFIFALYLLAYTAGMMFPSVNEALSTAWNYLRSV
ncbi:MAG TPA: PspC domain-containing protein [Candidatus Paceibacterota bacterium]|nr:PspC domain-containing protein [Candidatus Paceibacterota bacterium]